MQTFFSEINRSALVICSTMLWGAAEFIALQWALVREFIATRR